MLQNHDFDRITVSYQLKSGTTPLVNASNDTGLMQIDHGGTVVSNVREGNTIFSPITLTLVGTFGQFTGQAAAATTNRQHFTAAFKRAAIPAFVPAVLTLEPGSFTINADSGANAPGPVLPGDAPARFSTFTGVTQFGTQALFKATLTGCPTATNEGLFLGNGTRLLRKGDDVDAINLPGVKFGTLQRYWPAGSNHVIVQTTLTGTGVTTANNQALVLRQSDNTFIILLRTGTAAPGCGPAKLLSLSAVDVNPVSGRYVALGTLSGAVATNNQALWTGDATLGNNTTLKLLRTPALRLRKGQTYSTPATPLGLVKSLALKPAVDATGAGGRGLAQCIGSGGDMAVYVLGDRSVTELVMLPP